MFKFHKCHKYFKCK